MWGKKQLKLNLFQNLVSTQIVISSMLVCEQHYEGAKHNRKIAAELEKFHQAIDSSKYILVLYVFFPI